MDRLGSSGEGCWCLASCSGHTIAVGGKVPEEPTSKAQMLGSLLRWGGLKVRGSMPLHRPLGRYCRGCRWEGVCGGGWRAQGHNCECGGVENADIMARVVSNSLSLLDVVLHYQVPTVNACKTQYDSMMACEGCSADVSMMNLGALLNCFPRCNPIDDCDGSFSTPVEPLDCEDALRVEGNVLFSPGGSLPRQSSEGCVWNMVKGPNGFLDFQWDGWRTQRGALAPGNEAEE